MTQAFLLFDLDGTISDPLVGIARSFNFALEALGYAPRPMSDMAECIGPPLDESFRRFTGVTDEKTIDDLVAKYRERYFDIGYRENTLYPGIREAIHALAAQEVPMAVCTSKRQDIANRILRLFDLHDYFSFVSGGDVGVRKWQQIESLLTRQSIDRSARMIGDRALDLTAAHKNGLQSMGVLWGYGSRRELEAASPARLLSHPEEIAALAR